MADGGERDDISEREEGIGLIVVPALLASTAVSGRNRADQPAGDGLPDDD